MGFGTHYPKIQYLGLMNVKAEGVGENCGSRKVVLIFPYLLFSLISKDRGPRVKS